MALSCLSSSHEWDFPIFKVLANNDTGSAPGHQGGVVIPQDLRKFFPGLTGVTSAANPTIDHRINAQLFVENDYKGTVSTRYQFQTWGGARSPESRLTDQLGPLRNVAIGGDILIIQRSIDRLDYYRLTLVRKKSPEFPAAMALVVGRRWGAVTKTTPPVSDDDLRSAQIEEKALETAPFSLIDPTAGMVTTNVNKVARSIVFRTTIVEEYKETCAVCEEALRTPAGLIEIDAAHVVPRSLMGADDARNGFALCKRHHWAFDKGLFGIGDDRKVLVPISVSSIAQNTNLKKFHGHPIREANTSSLQVDARAFRWHRENLLIK